jgi:TetR/AcrR family transcriptional regulator, cholesterol catabolism regulator
LRLNGKRHSGDTRREIILKTAARLFREKGYEGTTVRDLADAVNLQSGSLFFHFRSKEEILLSILETGLLRAIAILDRNLVHAHTPREKLAAVLRGQLRAILIEDRDAFTTVLVDWRTLSARSRKRVIALRDEYEGHIKRVLDELSAAGAIPQDNRLFRLFLLGAMNWTVQWYRPEGDLTVDEVADGLLELFLPSTGQIAKKNPRASRATAAR